MFKPKKLSIVILLTGMLSVSFFNSYGLGNGVITSVQKTVLDVSKDLISLGIAKANMLPGDKSLNSAPLLEAAVTYAANNNIPIVNIPKGSYYFDARGKAASINIESCKNVDILGNGSSFIIQSRKSSGILIRNSSQIGLENFSLDYESDLPFTTAIVSSVDVSGRRISISSIQGRPITDFDNSGKNSIRIFVLRKVGGGAYKSVPIARMAIDKGSSLSNSSISIVGNPVVSNAILDYGLNQIQPGDLLSISERNYSGAVAIGFLGYPPIKNSGNYIKNVTINSSPSIGVTALWQSKFNCVNVKVIPKAGRSQYISSNADGINMTNSGAGCNVTNSTVIASGDDGISIASNLCGTVQAAGGGNAFVAALRYNLSIGEDVTLSDPDDLHEYLTSKITNIELVASPAGQLKQYKITLDTPTSGVKNGSFIFISKNYRSPGLVVQNNLIQKVNARGIYLCGVSGVQILSNTIADANSSGIMLQQLSELNGGFKSPGNSNITIRSNIINNAFSFGYNLASGGIEASMFGGDSKTAVVNNGLVIRDNNIQIAPDRNSRHVGIFISHTKGSDIGNNTIQCVTDNGNLKSLSTDRKIVVGAQVADIKEN
ncbi:hypothetical protein ACEN9X_17365 [Mucilaginibacter sp. Mucisp86]|uniref:hypothetical protein n=1 Tax=Mucilaginibacter sp. Mucisp86 TaxID=3243060 RepID=UPI0039B605D6